jgi:putative PIN family toxin of toxin-antitoxin system
LVLDTNGLLAAFLARGACHDLLEHCQRHHQIVLSAFILGEFRAKLTGKFRVADPAIKAAVALLRGAAEVVEPQPLPQPICRDADDDWILATALNGSCDVVVTGDKDLLAIGT